MAAARTPFEDTSVSVQRSQDQIRKFLREAGALGIQFEEDWEQGACRVRFAWSLGKAGNTNQVDRFPARQNVRLEVKALPPDRRFDSAQRERQAWRGLAHYLEGTIKAAAFGLIRFEDIFLSFMEAADGRTIGEVLIPQLERGQLALPRGDS